MTALAGPSSLGPHTLAEWHEADQPADGSRLELLAGSWSVSPAPDATHQYAGDELRALLHRALRAAGRHDLIALTAIAVDISSVRRSGLIPDVVICDRTTGPVVTADQVLLVGEVWSHHHRPGAHRETCRLRRRRGALPLGDRH